MTVVVPETAYAAPIVVLEAPKRGLHERINAVAEEFGISSTTLYNLALSESSLGKNRIGDGGKSCGVIHFHKDFYPLENSRCDDDEYILRRAAEMIRDGLEYKFSPCSCISTAKNLGVKIPPKTNASDLVPNVPLSGLLKGDLVLFFYKKSGEYHVARFDGLVGGKLSVSEGNYIACKAPTTRLVDVADPTIRGYWRAQ